MTDVGMIFEGGVAVVLCVAAFMCWRVDRRLAALRSGQDGVLGAVQALNEATARAERAIAVLRSVSNDRLELPMAAPVAPAPVTVQAPPASSPVRPVAANVVDPSRPDAMAAARALLARGARAR